MTSHDHPTLAELQGFLACRPGGKQNQRVVRHLLTGCPLCGEQLRVLSADHAPPRELFRRPGETAPEPEATPTSREHDYDEVLARAEQTLSYFLVNDRPVEEPPGELLAELFPLPAEAPGLWGESSRRTAIPQLVRWLVLRSHAVRYDSPEKMLHLAHLARLAVDACAAETVGSRQRLADLWTRAWGQFGNSLRVHGRIREAEEALATADGYLARGTGDPEIRARLCEQTASLHIFKRQFESALETIQEALRTYRELGELHLMARTQVQRSVALIFAGDPMGAIRVLRRALPHIDARRDPRLLLAARHNLLKAYIDVGQPEKALALSGEVQKLQSKIHDRCLLLRASWQEGQLLRDLDRLEPARAALLRTRQGFIDSGLVYEAAMVSLDLSIVCSKLGLAQESKAMASEAVPIFRSLRVGRELIASLIQLRRSSLQGEVPQPPSRP